MPVVVRLLEERERAALARAEELRAELGHSVDSTSPSCAGGPTFMHRLSIDHPNEADQHK